MRVLGQTVDDQTRCVHWNGALDVVALRFACCEEYYPCFECHSSSAGHRAALWPRARFDEPAVLCGVCRTELTVTAYLGTDSCSSCGAGFNPGCALHYDLYFEM